MNDSSVFVCSPTADDLFGPMVHGCRDGFDFTLTFEQCIFSILPAAFLLLAAPFRIHYLGSLPTTVRGAFLRHSKLVSGTHAQMLKVVSC
jgi:ATP-binding cassette subfamily C (CFTR/MRP) protein 1